jgi:hypothetical protein
MQLPYSADIPSLLPHLRLAWAPHSRSSDETRAVKHDRTRLSTRGNIALLTLSYYSLVLRLSQYQSEVIVVGSRTLSASISRGDEVLIRVR